MLVLMSVFSVLTEWLLYTIKPLWKLRRSYIGLPIVLTTFGFGTLVVTHWNLWLIPLFFVAIFRIVNHLRIAEGRMHEWYLWHKARRTGLVLGVVQLFLLWGLVFISLIPSETLKGLVLAQAVTGVIVLFLTARNILKSKHRPVLENFADNELPTVTVAIPARNETIALEDCLVQSH